MPYVEFAEEMLHELEERDSRFDRRAYLHVLAALQAMMDRLAMPRHISADELAREAGRLALERYGVLARTVLEHWGVHSTAEFGAIVFHLVEAGVLVKQEGDRIEDFEDVFDFGEIFERGYPWGARI
ncbi:MAG: hypothetical protein RQ745_07060 [Longimicrobiales bacterium]|nr:hypothetical protein [Longimicrobiales bacterium]